MLTIIFLSAAEERAVATRPAPSTDFFALALFLVGIIEWEENWLSYYDTARWMIAAM